MSYEHKDAASSYEQAVDVPPENYAWSEWFVYPDYDIGGGEGCKYVYAPMADRMRQLRGRRRYRPLSRPTAALFLEFARWPETEGMDLKPFESKKNAAAAREWAEINGVLGLDSSRPFAVFDKASHATIDYLGVRAVHSRTRNEGEGGREETVEAFAREAWLANMTLRLYEAATNPEGPDMETIVNYMTDEKEALADHLPSERQLHGKSPEHACSWALDVVEEIVEDRLRGHVWPLPVRDRNDRLYGYAGHKQGWAFDSLLGAMWLQMMWLMRGHVRRCQWCGKLLDMGVEEGIEDSTTVGAGGKRKPRSDRRFCDNSGRCKAKWNYHRGTGASSKEARRKNRSAADPDTV